MRNRSYIAAMAAIIVCAMPVAASAQPHVGVVMWRHDTDMTVTQATDWDGSNDTADQRARDWDFKSSGVGLQAGYMFAEIFAVHGNLGVAQATARAIDLSDADFDMTSRGLDEGLFFDIGASASDHFPASANVFWGANLSARIFSSQFDQDVTTTWELDETTLSVDGRIGYLLNSIGVYGGLRFVSNDTDVQITDVSRTPGQQTRTINFERDRGTDLLVGAEFRGAPLSGFVELGFLGSFSASTGLAVHY